jgi:hypothetical protein
MTPIDPQKGGKTSSLAAAKRGRGMCCGRSGQSGDGARSPDQKCSTLTQKCSTSTPKLIYLRPDKFICAQINPPIGGFYLRANKNPRIHR